MTWRPRLSLREQKRREDGFPVLSLGLAAGYWPCLQAPFVRIDVGPLIIEAWVGWPSYQPRGIFLI